MFGDPSTDQPPPQANPQSGPPPALLGFGGLGADTLTLGGQLLTRIESTLQEDTDDGDQPFGTVDR